MSPPCINRSSLASPLNSFAADTSNKKHSTTDNHSMDKQQIHTLQHTTTSKHQHTQCWSRRGRGHLHWPRRWRFGWRNNDVATRMDCGTWLPDSEGTQRWVVNQGWMVGQEALCSTTTSLRPRVNHWDHLSYTPVLPDKRQSHQDPRQDSTWPMHKAPQRCSWPQQPSLDRHHQVQKCTRPIDNKHVNISTMSVMDTPPSRNHNQLHHQNAKQLPRRKPEKTSWVRNTWAQQTDWHSGKQRRRSSNRSSKTKFGPDDAENATPGRTLKGHFILKWSKWPSGLPRAKARFITQGFRDPDALAGKINTESPTLSRISRNYILTVAATKQWTALTADIIKHSLLTREGTQQRRNTVDISACRC